MWVLIVSLTLGIFSWLKGAFDLFAKYVGYPIAIILTTLGLFIFSYHTANLFIAIYNQIKNKKDNQNITNSSNLMEKKQALYPILFKELKSQETVVWVLL